MGDKGCFGLLELIFRLYFMTLGMFCLGGVLLLGQVSTPVLYWHGGVFVVILVLIGVFVRVPAPKA